MRTPFTEKGESFPGRFSIVFILLGIFLILLFYAHIHIRTLNLGYKYILLQNRKLKLKNRNFHLRKQLSERLAFERIDKESLEKLDLVYPDFKRIYVLRVPVNVVANEEKDMNNSDLSSFSRRLGLK
mgnify:CR=1 FL=1